MCFLSGFRADGYTNVKADLPQIHTVKDELDMSNEQKTPAELYREERKERIAKASKKSAKKALRAPRSANAGKIISIILVVAIALAACWGILDYTGVIQRTISVGKAGGESVSIAEYNYYYMQSFTRIYETARQYESNYASSYGAGVGKQYTGFDYTIAPDKQEYPTQMQTEDMPITALDGGNATWADYFRISALTLAGNVNHFHDLAVEAGITLGEDDKTQIEDTIKSMRDAATEGNYSLNRFLTVQCGDGVNENLYKSLITRQQLAALYYEKIEADKAAEVSEDAINAKYAEDPSAYDTIDFKFFTMQYKDPAEASQATEGTSAEAETTTLPTSADALKQMNEMLSKVTTSEEFRALAYTYAPEASKKNYETDDGVFARSITKSSVSSMPKDASDWLFSSERAAGDKIVINDEDNDAIFLFLMVTPVHRDDTVSVSVRHILFKYPTTTDEEGNTVDATDAAKAETLKKAQDMLASFNTNPSEDAFATLAKDNTEDTGSKENGGLYENIYPGEMVYEFDKWSFDPARKPGDTAIVTTVHGYHIMYFSATGTESSWHSTIKTSLADEAFNTYITEASKTIFSEFDKREWLITRRANSLNQFIKMGFYSSTTTV